jgi:hypothetical protein
MKCGKCGTETTLVVQYEHKGIVHDITHCTSCDTYYIDGEAVNPPDDAGALED